MMVREEEGSETFRDEESRMRNARLITTSEAARIWNRWWYMRVTSHTIRRWCEAGRMDEFGIAYTKVGRQHLIDYDSMLAVLWEIMQSCYANMKEDYEHRVAELAAQGESLEPRDADELPEDLPGRR
jgi:hypothetical protein